MKGGVAGGSILHGVLRINDEIELRPGIVQKDKEGKIKCDPIFSRYLILSLCGQQNAYMYILTLSYSLQDRISIC